MAPTLTSRSGSTLGEGTEPELHHEELDFDVVEPTTRSYK